jgi:hypothetical protein
MRYFVRGADKNVLNFFPPLAGFAICLLLWLSLNTAAKIAGAVWLVVGIIYGVIKTRGFRGDLVDFELPPENA